jgi:putative oxidoreductase
MPARVQSTEGLNGGPCILRAAAVKPPSESRDSWGNIAALTFVRIYVGLMFVPHFGSHILGGPYQFKIYTFYFASRNG